VKQHHSIGTHISAIIGLLVFILVLIFTESAIEAFNREREATDTLSVVHIERELLSAKEDIRVEQWYLGNALSAPEGASAQTKRPILAADGRLTNSLAAVVEGIGMRPANRSSSSRAGLAATISRYNLTFRKAIGLLQYPRVRRSKTVASDWRLALVGLMNDLNSEANALSIGVTSTDPFINTMTEVNKIAWTVRMDAGNDRRNLLNAINGSRGLSNDQIHDFVNMNGRLDALWQIVEDDAAKPSFPQDLTAAVEQASIVYFTQFRATRQKVIDRLAAGKSMSISDLGWMMQSNPGLASIATVSKTALDLTEVHATEQLVMARRILAIALVTMCLSIGLAAFVMLYILRRVIRPLKLITRAMKSIVDGDLRHKIPFKKRQDEIGHFARALQMFRDSAIEKQQLEAELLCNQVARDAAEASSRVKSEFLANMSHELRTPLNAIIGFSDLMQHKLFGPLSGKYEQYAILISEAGHHLLDLVSDVLDLAKIEAGKLSLQPEPVDLGEVLDYCVRLVKPSAEQRCIGLMAELPEAPLTLVADNRACKQILLNLLSNAVKFSRDGGQVIIGVVLAGDCVSITVRDNGIGIPASALSRIGHAFEQASNDPLLAREGTGLGLALVRALVGQHGGSMRIESRENEGTAVTVELPLSRNGRMAA
jgi:signal transduction histidine kinase